MFTKILLSIGALIFVSGCQTATKRYEAAQEGQWQARALIKDGGVGRSFIVNLNFNLVRDQAARMDVTTALGSGVASLLVDDKEVRYVLVDSKRYYEGAPSVDVMLPILTIPFDPRWIENILFEQPIEGAGWVCSRDDKDLLTECRDQKVGLTVHWSSRRGNKKTILLEHSKASVQINVQSFSPKVEVRENLFSLEAPKGYQKLRVR